MTIGDVVCYLEGIAPPQFQEDYDNSGLIVGEYSTACTGVIISLDCLESIVDEAISKNCNLIVSHHPIVFQGLKRFNNQSYVHRTVQKAIANNINLYAIHTNLDNVLESGVNQKIASRLALSGCKILRPKQGNLLKLSSFVPQRDKDQVLEALFASGAGEIGNYSECSFSSEGIGSFTAKENSAPHVGEIGEKHFEEETKIEVILRKYQMNRVISALKQSHPYEEVAFDVYPILNADQQVGSGLIGELNASLSEEEFLTHLKNTMELNTIKFTSRNKNIKKVALCGGSGRFLLNDAIRSGADAFVSSDFKYHEYFDAENQITICDIGHFESEKYTIDLLYDILSEKFTTFAVLKTETDTNPVKYFH